jgi:hypothetical protein
MALVRTDVSEEHIGPTIRVTRISNLGITLAVTSNRIALMMEAIWSSESWILYEIHNAVTSQETVLFIATSVKTSNLT